MLETLRSLILSSEMERSQLLQDRLAPINVLHSPGRRGVEAPRSLQQEYASLRTQSPNASIQIADACTHVLHQCKHGFVALVSSDVQVLPILSADFHARTTPKVAHIFCGSSLFVHTMCYRIRRLFQVMVGLGAGATPIGWRKNEGNKYRRFEAGGHYFNDE